MFRGFEMASSILPWTIVLSWSFCWSIWIFLYSLFRLYFEAIGIFLFLGGPDYCPRLQFFCGGIIRILTLEGSWLGLLEHLLYFGRLCLDYSSAHCIASCFGYEFSSSSRVTEGCYDYLLKVWTLWVFKLQSTYVFHLLRSDHRLFRFRVLGSACRYVPLFYLCHQKT